MAERSPQRTCVGCRECAVKHDLLRVVAVGNELVPDLDSRMPGRGAYLHPALVCLDLADRRRAFVRALRITGGLDVRRVRAHLAEDGAAQAGGREGEGRDAREQGIRGST